MAGDDEPPEPVKMGFARLDETLRRAHAQSWDFTLVTPSPVEGRAVIEITAPDGSARRRYAFPEKDIDRVAELLATLNVDAADI
jgi:hypothetical protein